MQNKKNFFGKENSKIEYALVLKIFSFFDSKTLFSKAPCVNKKWYKLAAIKQASVFIQKAEKLLKQFESDIKNIKDNAIIDCFKYLPQGARGQNILQDSILRIQVELEYLDLIRSTLEAEIERILKLFESKIIYIESDSSIYVQKINSIEFLGNLANQYFRIKKALARASAKSLVPHKYFSSNSFSRWQDHRLWLEQQLICKHPKIYDAFESLMQEIRKTAELNFLIPSCFICYAWASKEATHEKWIQPFLSNLREHLRKAAIPVELDIKDNPPGGNIYSYMDKISETDCVIIVGTESLLQKHQRGTSAVCNELILVQRKRIRQRGKTFPILLSGDLRAALPPYFELYSTVRDWHDNSYLFNLKEILRALYGLGKDSMLFNNIWREFESRYQVLFNTLPEVSINQHLKKHGHIGDELNKTEAEELFNCLSVNEDEDTSPTFSFRK